ncbi:hypothetical protein EZS27_020735 [termite gut metagenome]|uniref:Uncharacterized protein n=1 Tax=termite gut metagenome TaxID=433724 RepID=A0A5J4RCX3_9ZZZZ
MRYVVLHVDKSPGNESAMTDHIKRNVIHPNVDPNRIHLNKDLIKFSRRSKQPDGSYSTPTEYRRTNTVGRQESGSGNPFYAFR